MGDLHLLHHILATQLRSGIFSAFFAWSNFFVDNVHLWVYSIHIPKKEVNDMKKYVADYGIIDVQLVSKDKLPKGAEYLGSDDEYFYFKADGKCYVSEDRPNE